jgi:predicted naringenin-chalcone synthase
MSSLSRYGSMASPQVLYIISEVGYLHEQSPDARDLTVEGA